MKISRKSSRVPLKRKYSVDGKVKEHKRRMRKAAKASAVRRKIRKDPGVPSLWPFKSELLTAAIAEKKRAEEEKKAKRLEAKEAKKKLKQQQLQGNQGIDDEDMEEGVEGDAEGSSDSAAYAALVSGAEAAGLRYDARAGDDQEHGIVVGPDGRVHVSRRAFARDLRKVINQSDVVLEVLDARDPIGCRCPELETEILSQPGKKLVLVLNKIDLVPREVAIAWLKHLRQSLPAVAFKSRLQTSGRGRQAAGDASTVPDWQLASSSYCVGVATLTGLLRNYARSSCGKSLTVGVIGCPNVGKSSVINSLKRETAVRVGAEAGVTRGVQEVALEGGVKILDSPGVVFDAEGETGPSSVLRNSVKLQIIKDPEPLVTALLKRCPPEAAVLLMRHFEIPAFNSVEEFLAHIARARGLLVKGGRPDLVAAGRAALSEWTTGRLRYYTLPPAQPDETCRIVFGQPTREVDIENLLENNDKELEKIKVPTSSTVNALAMSSGSHVKEDEAIVNSVKQFVIDATAVDRRAAQKAAPCGAKEENAPLKSKRRRALLVDVGAERLPTDALAEVPVDQKQKVKEKARREKKSNRRMAATMDVDNEGEEAAARMDDEEEECPQLVDTTNESTMVQSEVLARPRKSKRQEKRAKAERMLEDEQFDFGRL